MRLKERESEVWKWLAEVMDPEVPVLTILDLGIVREVEVSLGEDGSEELRIVITPTYSGCPAMDVIAAHIRMALAGRGFSKVDLSYQLSPAWTTDWLSEEGKEKLKEYGIAPPLSRQNQDEGRFASTPVPCPRCGAADTEQISQFGATACKALYRCKACLEPFEYFKCH